MAKPRLLWKDEPAGNAGYGYGEFAADGISAIRIPGQGRGACGQIVRARKIDEGGEQVARGRLARFHKLWDLEMFNFWNAARVPAL